MLMYEKRKYIKTEKDIGKIEIAEPVFLIDDLKKEPV